MVYILALSWFAASLTILIFAAQILARSDQRVLEMSVLDRER